MNKIAKMRQLEVAAQKLFIGLSSREKRIYIRATASSNWFARMNPDLQRQYLTEHPNSRLALEHMNEHVNSAEHHKTEMGKHPVGSPQHHYHKTAQGLHEEAHRGLKDAISRMGRGDSSRGEHGLKRFQDAVSQLGKLKQPQ